MRPRLGIETWDGFGFVSAFGLVSLRATQSPRVRSRTLSLGWPRPAFVCLEKEKPRKAGADCGQRIEADDV